MFGWTPELKWEECEKILERLERGQIMRDLVCHVNEFELHFEGKEKPVKVVLLCF